MPNSKNTFDNLLETVGGFGLYQILALAILCVSNCFNGMSSNFAVLILHTPDHRCWVEGLDDSEFVDFGEYWGICASSIRLLRPSFD